MMQLPRLLFGLLAFGAASAAGAEAPLASPLGGWFEQALQHPAVIASAQQQRAAEIGERAATLAYLGSGNAGAEVMHYNDERFSGMFTPEAFLAPIFDQDITRYGVSYALPIDLFGAIAASRQAARSERAAAELALRQQQLLSLHAVTGQYARLVSLRDQAAMLDTQGARIEQTLARVQRQFDNGDAATADLRLAEAEQARIDAERERLSAARAEALAALAAAVGHEVEDPGTPLPAVPAWFLDADVDSALPVALAEAQAEGLSAQARLTRRSLYPSIAAVADYSRFEASQDIPEAWTVGARVSLPLDPSGWQRARAQASMAEAAHQDIDSARRRYRQQLASLAAAYRSAQAEAVAVEAERTALEEVVSVRTELHRVGMTSTEDLLRQERDLREANVRLSLARAQALTAWSAAALLQGLDAGAYRQALTAAP